MTMKVEPRAEHEWLRRLVAEWAGSSESLGPDGNAAPPWTETGRMVGDIWVVVEGVGQMPGGEPSHTLMQLGYDPARGRFVGTWLGSMMTHMWVYEGTLDASGQVLTLETEGPDFGTEGRTTRYQDIIAFDGADRRTLTSMMLGVDGTWSEVMRADYVRKG